MNHQLYIIYLASGLGCFAANVIGLSVFNLFVKYPIWKPGIVIALLFASIEVLCAVIAASLGRNYGWMSGVVFIVYLIVRVRFEEFGEFIRIG